MRLRFEILFILILLSGCDFGPWEKDNEPKPSFAEKVELIKTKRDLYCDKSRSKVMDNGWAVSKCDGLLWTSLHRVGCGHYPDIKNFEDTRWKGRWYRSPGHDCFIIPSTDAGANSTISKDMFAGLLLYLWVDNQKKSIDSLVEYGESNNWKMGDAIDLENELGKVILPPTTQSLIYDMQSILEKHKLVTLISKSTSAFKVNSGFRAHLDILGIITRWQVYRTLNDFDLKTLKSQSERQPENALFEIIYSVFDSGDLNSGADLLLDEKYFPSTDLPNSHHHYCSDYLYQRDKDNKDWEPCRDRPIVEHYGTDFIFASWVLLKAIEN